MTNITRVERWLVRMPFKEEILWASGRRTGATRLVTRIVTDDGIEGWGETICLIEPVRAVFDAIVAKVAVGYNVSEVERFGRHVLGAGYYHHKRAAVMATAALEMAMWDALGKRAGLPLHALWGGRWRDRVEASAYLFLPDPVACAEKAKWFLDQGYTTFKVKIGFDERSDVALLEGVRRAIGDLSLRADVNGAWFLPTAKRLLHRMAPLDLAYVEQPLPLDDLPGHAALRVGQPVPLALDESAYTLEDVAAIIREDAADVVLLDPHEAGGIWQTIKAAGICEAVNIPVTLHSGGELAISQAAYVHIAASVPNMALAIDTERAYLADDIAPDAPRIVDGSYDVPTGPGLGVTPDLEAIHRYEVDGIAGAYLDDAKPGWFPTKPELLSVRSNPATGLTHEVVPADGSIRMANARFEVGIRPEVGGSICFFRTRSGHEILRNARTLNDAAASSCFAMVPFCNRLRDRAFVWEGCEQRLEPNTRDDQQAAHGFGWRAAWRVISHTSTSAHLRHCHAAGGWPWSYVAEQRMRLDDRRVRN